MKIQINSNSKRLKAIVISVMMLASAPLRAADWGDLFSGCLMASAGGLAGTAYASQNLKDNKQIDATGMAISGVVSCLGGMAFVSLTYSSSKYKAEYELKKQNEEYGHELLRASKEKCLLTGTCTAGSKAIIVETPNAVSKQGDSVIESSKATIEANK
jgi:hypothetical protein